MKYLILLAIRLYWCLPLKSHDRCIFKETCSHYIYRITGQNGTLAGIKAFMERNRLCRPGYVVYKFHDKFYLRTAEGTIHEEEEINVSVLPPHREQYYDFDILSNSERLRQIN